MATTTGSSGLSSRRGQTARELRPHVSQRLRWTRFASRVLSNLTSLVIIAVVGFHAVYWYRGITLIIVAAVPAVLSTIWGWTDAILLLVPRQQGAHPVACSVLDALICCSFGGLSCFLAIRLTHDDYYGTDSELHDIIIGFGFVSSLLHLVALILAALQLRKSRAAGSIPVKDDAESVQSGPELTRPLQPQDIPLADFPAPPAIGADEAPPAYTQPASPPPRRDSISAASMPEEMLGESRPGEGSAGAGPALRDVFQDLHDVKSGTKGSSN